MKILRTGFFCGGFGFSCPACGAEQICLQACGELVNLVGGENHVAPPALAVFLVFVSSPRVSRNGANAGYGGHTGARNQKIAEICGKIAKPGKNNHRFFTQLS